jgi:hypothetical protein
MMSCAALLPARTISFNLNLAVILWKLHHLNPACEETLMSTERVAPYGSWKSPITSELIVKGSIGLGQVALDGDDIYWLESRPQEGGRSCIVRLSADGQVSDVTPRDFNARTRVHEYGGGDYAVADGTVYFSN